MGRKRNRTGKRFYLFIACLVLAVLGGCAAVRETQDKKAGLDAAHRYFDSEDYESALKEYLKVVSTHRHSSPGDEALFYAGLVYVHRNNYGKSLDCFKKLLKGFPQSLFYGQAKIWVGILQDYEKLNLQVEELSRGVKKSHYEQERLTRENEELKKTIKKSRQVDIEIDGKKKELLK